MFFKQVTIKTKTVFRYLKQIINYNSKISSNILWPLLGYADSDWVRENDRKSTGRYIFKLYGNCIVWNTNQ